jgi:predicted CoA-binding protein
MPTYSDTLIKSVLRSTRVIAMIGASANQQRASFFVLQYLTGKGYEVHPVNPGLAGTQIEGRTVYASLKDIPAPVDMVDVFRNADAVPGVLDETLAEKDRLGIKTFWLQLGIVNEDPAAKAEAAGWPVIRDRCPKIEYGRYSGEIGWMGVNRGIIDNRKPALFGKGGTLKHQD